MNIVILSGNLTKDPENGTTTNGTAYARFTLAVNKKDGADFFNCTVWRAAAELAGKYLRKGSKCCVVGEISQREYEQDGIKRRAVEINVNQIDITFREDKEDKPEKVTNLTPVEDELPF